MFSVLRVLNVAHGSLYSIGGYVAASLCLFIASRQLNPYLSFAALLFSAVFVAAIFGPLIERSLVRWTYGKSEAVQILITFGLFLMLEDLQRMIFGVQSFYEDAPMRLLGTLTIGGVVYLNYQILLIGMALLVVISLRLLVNHTRLGRLITAVVTDREMAQSIGIDTNRIFILAFSLGVFLAALGGALATPTSGIAPGLGADTMVLAFAVAAIGGLGQIEGAAVASLIVGVARVLAIYLVPSLDAVAPYAAMLVVLLIRPYGLFGSMTARRI
nr:high-affinity branched-chain amino acid transport system permease protein BraD [Bradyrhizobium sp. DOA9]